MDGKKYYASGSHLTIEMLEEFRRRICEPTPEEQEADMRAMENAAAYRDYVLARFCEAMEAVAEPAPEAQKTPQPSTERSGS